MAIYQIKERVDPDAFGEPLSRRLERWSHRIPQLSKIGDSGLLHERCEKLADEMLNYEGHHLWDIIESLPNELL